MKRQTGDQGISVHRDLFAVCAAYLCGVCLTQAIHIPTDILIIVGALFVGAAIFRRARRKRALFCVMALALILAYGRAADYLVVHDMPTEPGATLSGTVTKIETDLRVYLSDVRVDSAEPLSRQAVVTLMLNEDEMARSIEVGQVVYGTGRLFAQEEARNPGGYDRRIQALCDGYDLSGYLLPGWSVQGEPRFSVAEQVRRIRVALLARLEAIFGEQAPLFQAILLGDRSGLEDDVEQAMRMTGIAHLLTVSGMHLSFVGLSLHALFRMLPVGRKTRLAAHGILLGAFAMLTGGAAGTIRAYIMSMMREIAAYTGRRYDALTSLAAAALLMHVFCPIWVLNASFQFSFFVVLGILLLQKQAAAFLGCERKEAGIAAKLKRMFALSACAQFAAAPMQLALYGYLPLSALVMNMIGGLLMPFLMIGGGVVLAVSLFSLKPAVAMARIAAPAAMGIERLSLLFAEQGMSVLRLPAPYRWTLILFALMMICASAKIYIPRKRKTLCGFLAASVMLCYLMRLSPQLCYVQLDVGQGDGALIRKGRHAVLLDVGPESEYAMLHYLRHEGLFVDAVILSHMDEDHAGALDVLLASEIDVDRVITAVGAQNEIKSETVASALESVKARGIALEAYEEGDCFSAGAWTFHVLSPDAKLTGSNERSLVLSAELGALRLLTLGDLTEEAERCDWPQCDLLKVAHHGSEYATSSALIDAASPELAIVSVGENWYGHPSERVLNDLNAVGAQIYRTDLCGCITVAICGDSYEVKPFVKK